MRRWVCGFVAVLLSGAVAADPEYYVYLKYMGSEYQTVKVSDNRQTLIFERKLLPGQGMTLPVDIAIKKQLFFVSVANQLLTVRIGCSSGKVKKQLGQGLIEFDFHNTPQPCVYKRSEVAVPEPAIPTKDDVAPEQTKTRLENIKA